MDQWYLFLEQKMYKGDLTGLVLSVMNLQNTGKAVF